MMISYYLTSHKTWWVVNMVGEVSIRVVELGGHHTQVDPVECSTRTGLTLHGLQGVISRQWPGGNSESRFPKIWWSTCVDHRARFYANTGAIFKIKKGKKCYKYFFFFLKSFIPEAQSLIQESWDTLFIESWSAVPLMISTDSWRTLNPPDICSVLGSPSGASVPKI